MGYAGISRITFTQTLLELYNIYYMPPSWEGGRHRDNRHSKAHSLGRLRRPSATAADVRPGEDARESEHASTCPLPLGGG